ncbi:hypothetical protein [Caballeronia grimmiae]
MALAARLLARHAALARLDLGIAHEALDVGSAIGESSSALANATAFV